MSIGLVHRWALVSMLGLAAAGVMPGSTVLTIAGACLLGLMALRARHLLDTERARTSTILVHSITVLVLLGAIAAFRRLTIDSAVVVVLLGVANRFLLRSGHRDDLILAGAAGVLMAMATTVTPGIGFLAIVLAFIPAVHVALWAAQLLSAADLMPVAERKSALAILAARPAPRRFAFLATTSLSLTTLGYAVLIFFPRYRFLGWLGAGSLLNLAGAANSMELRSSGVPAPTGGAVVMRIEPGTRTQPIDLEGLYARMYVLDHFDGRTFAGDQGEYYAGKGPRAPVLAGRAKAVIDESRVGAARVTLDRTSPRGSSQAVAILGRSRPTQVGLNNLEQSGSGTWWSPIARAAENLRYSIDLGRPIELARFTEADEAALVARNLEVPRDLDPRIVGLAEGLVRGRTTTSEKVQAILGHFDRGYRYSLDPLPGESSDPLVRFLFEAKQGHCELYAGAVTVLLRVAGVPARVATGYYGGRWNPRGRFLEMTSADAHAWVELYDERTGWSWIDATPEDLRSRRGQATFAWLTDMIAVLDAFWYEQVIDFDEARRKALLKGFTGELGDWASDLGGLDGESKSQGAGRAGRWSAILLVPLAGAAIWMLRRRARSDASKERLGLALRKALGAGRGENLTLGQLLLRSAPDRVAVASKAVDLYEALRFGPSEASPSPAEVRAAIRAVGKIRRGAQN